MYLWNGLYAHVHPLPSMHMLQHQIYIWNESEVKTKQVQTKSANECVKQHHKENVHVCVKTKQEILCHLHTALS